jgi:putative flavoprotein involved in K+ transport
MQLLFRCKSGESFAGELFYLWHNQRGNRSILQPSLRSSVPSPIIADIIQIIIILILYFNGSQRGSDKQMPYISIQGEISMAEELDTIIIGGGQAGISTSYHLKQHGRDHVILEQSERAAKAWRERWDSFTLITPNWTIRLPGAEYQGDDPDGFMHRDDVISYFEDYIERFDLPIRYGVRVDSVGPIENGYRVTSNAGEFKAANVVIATGLHQQPKIPPFSSKLPEKILQLHSSQYRNPQDLHEGAVLVVGSAQSGSQIAEELYQLGRKVYLSVSTAGRIPRRYRGKDVVLWLDETGMAETTVDQLASPKDKFGSSAHGTGKDGGHTISMHQFARDGVMLLGRIQDVHEDRIILAPDLYENLAKADQFEANFIQHIDAFIDRNGLDAPPERLPELRDGFDVELISELDCESAGIRSVIWATGYKYDFSIVKLPVFDEDGYPLQQRGITKYPGLFFVGMPFLYNGKSGLLSGVGDDAAHVASVIVKEGKLERPVV